MVDKAIRTRFAPSPTGFLHVGAARTALFAWLVARQNQGQFVLRIEDTDQARGVTGAEAHIIESLRWLNLLWDEGPNTPQQPFGPYRQSERLDIYKKWAQRLIDAGRAYADPYTPEEVQGFREQAQKAKKPFLYRDHRPNNPPEWDNVMPLRFKSEPKPYAWHDEVMGDLSTGPEVIDDFILIKSDGFPTYNFAHIVDDAEMRITHVIRGQEFLASMPNYLNLYEALELELPIFATMPPILGPDGKKKLSKRDGAKDILEYREEGYFWQAMQNFLASMGWNDGTEDEIFSEDELIKKFRLDRVQRSTAVFDEKRLLWMNGARIRNMPTEDLYKRLSDPKPGFWPSEAFQSQFDEAYRISVLELIKERLKFFSELPELTRFFFNDLPVNPELISSNNQLSKLTQAELKDLLAKTKASLEQSNFNVHDLTDRLNQLLEQTGQKPGVLFSLIRIATTQAPASPALAETLAVLGKEVSLRRINQTLEALAS